MLPSVVRSFQILSAVCLLTAASVVRAQTPLTTCGAVDIDGPSEAEPGTPLVFKAKITGTMNSTKPEFKWKVSAGTITSGEGTEEIIVDSTGLGGVELIATVELSGAPPGCKGSASKTTKVKVVPIACGLPLDEYGDIRFEDEKARLDNFAIQLSNEPLSSGQILMYAGQKTFKNEAAERLARAKSYLVKVRETDPNRIVTLDCGFRKDLSIRLIIVPSGVRPPGCDDFLQIPFSEVRFTKPRPKSSKRRR
jgi:hypothetical protein